MVLRLTNVFLVIQVSKMKAFVNLEITNDNTCNARILDPMGHVKKETFSCARNAEIILIVRYKDITLLDTQTFDGIIAGGCFN